jgi:large subunit ribosomal protein L10
LAISRERKEALIAEYRQQYANSAGVVFADYSALSVAQMENLRQRARELNGQVFVVKNTLFNLVLNEAHLTPPAALLKKTTLVAFCHQDVPSLAKLFRDYMKEVEEGRFVVKGGLLEGNFLTAAQTLAIADLPSREELLAQVLRTINAPATQTVGVVAGGIRQVMNVIKAYADKLEEAGGVAEATI